MGRWKGDGKGGSYYDPNDSGPDQVTPPLGATQQNTGGQPSGGTPSPDYAPPSGNTGVAGGQTQFDWGEKQPSFQLGPIWNPNDWQSYTGGIGYGGSPGPGNVEYMPKQPWQQGTLRSSGDVNSSRPIEEILTDRYAAEQQQNTPTDPTGVVAPPSAVNPLDDASRIDFSAPVNSTAGPAIDPRYTPSTAQAPAISTNTGMAPGIGQAPPGFEQDKWADPTKGTSKKYQVGRILAAGGTIQDAANAVGAKVISADKIQYPDGFIADVFRDVEGEHQIQYTDVTGERDGSSTASGTGGSFTGAGGNTGFSGYGGGNFGGFGGNSASGGFSSSYGGAFSNPRASSLYDILAGRAGQGLAVNARDPIIANQVDSFRAEQERGARNYIDAQAESQGPSANLGSERRLASERAAQTTGGLQAQLMGSELNARRQEIQNALSQMGGMLTSEQSLALQRELGLIDAALRQQGITNQNNQFLDDWSLRNTEQANYWDRDRSRGTS